VGPTSKDSTKCSIIASFVDLCPPAVHVCYAGRDRSGGSLLFLLLLSLTHRSRFCAPYALFVPLQSHRITQQMQLVCMSPWAVISPTLRPLAVRPPWTRNLPVVPTQREKRLRSGVTNRCRSLLVRYSVYEGLNGICMYSTSADSAAEMLF
jgi:hypothetical protein